MKVFEGPVRETAKDITFMYNADFFLYASLHHESDGQHGRPNPQNGPPVLTGMPVSSMILLDRPEEAGYFIFSDLSVRHEGRYYLTFALMEEVKEDRDKDIDEAMSGVDEITGPDASSSDRHFSFRTKVQTDVFDVFSAKKFPGLQESTALSRTVAEQGCRVRIRRDVRMRRREKGGKGKDPAPPRQEEFAPKPRVEASPHIRGRSSSNETSGTYPDANRRQSGMEYTPSSRTSFAASETSAGRQPPYGPVAPYPSQSMPNSPSYPPPPHGAQYQPRPPYGHYSSERSPTHSYGPPVSQPAAPHRDSYTYRHDQPMLAPKLEPDPEIQRLPPMRHLNGSPAEPRRPSYTPQPVARLMPHPPPKRDAPPEPASYQLPPMVRPFDQRPSPPMPLAPPTTTRKRTATDAFETLSPESYRLQNGRRQDEQPRDANYKVEMAAPYGPIASEQSAMSQRHGSSYQMSDPNYNRASDKRICVNFPSLHG